MANKNKNEQKKKTQKKKENSFAIKMYLIGYNVVQTAGWSYLLYQFVTFLLFAGPTENLYEKVKWTVIIFQNAALLEVMHAATGVVPSNALITLVQVLSRVMLVCGAMIPASPTRDSIGFSLCLTAWSITEIIRYGFYSVNLLGMTPYALLWLRYTLFIALYPIGITGELLCLYAAQDYVKKTGLWSFELPNTWNFTFSYQYFIIAVMLTYIPVFPKLYLHMFSQRKKIIGGFGSSLKDKAK